MGSSGRFRSSWAGVAALVIIASAALAIGGEARGGAARESRAVVPGAAAQVRETGASARALETMMISNTDPKPKRSATVLKASHRYRLVGSGTVSDWCDGGSTPCNPPLVLNDGVDALYCYATWRCQKPELWRQLQVNGVGLDQLAGKDGKIPYSAGHVYTVEVTGIPAR